MENTELHLKTKADKSENKFLLNNKLLDNYLLLI